MQKISADGARKLCCARRSTVYYRPVPVLGAIKALPPWGAVSVNKIALACALIGALVVSAVSVIAAELTVANSSDYVIHKLFVSSSKSRNWGPDQLGKETIGRAQRFTLRNIPDGVYDLKIVDEDDDECIVEGVRIAGDMMWTLTDTVIENCVEE